ncbi:MAG: efflux RND transporter periplasmic adaptor subunit [Verrucomicrobia bacterium]|nr:efflux RND transporter periplasmic adaptor subunit [Verrucomicrobiota bacterium]
MNSLRPFLLSFLLAVPLLAAAVTYQCPMHPWIKSDHAGAKCTICGMDLVVASAAGQAAADPNVVSLSPAGASVVGVQTAAVTRGPLVRTLRVAGVVDDDDTRHRIIGARIPGRVEKLFVNYVGAEVREGDPLAIVYSPEMLTAQRQYVERLRAGAAFTESDRAAARERLLNLGLLPQEIDILEHTLEPTAMVNVRAPMSGTVVSRHVYEGQEINKDQSEAGSRLFEIADFSTMWFMFDAYEPDLAWLRVGEPAEVTVPSQPGRVYTAAVTFIDPNIDPATHTAKVRVNLPNYDHALFHKQTGYATIRLTVPEVLAAPRSAVLQHGEAPIVFVEQADRTYAQRRVRLGRTGDDAVEIVAGLHAGERVVTEGGLLLDSQTQLARAALPPEPPAPLPAPVPSGPDPAALAAASYGPLKTLAFAAADGAAALATDDLATYQRQLPALRDALAAFLAADPHDIASLARYRESLRDPPDLRTARRDFEPFSTALADAARARALPAKEGLHVYQCPMAPVLGTGRWLSRSPTVQNPFFGSAMPGCGDEVPGK